MKEWVHLMEAVCINPVNSRIIAVVFYTDDGLVTAREPKTLQDAVDILIFLFEQVGLVTNTNNTEVMVFLPERIRTWLNKQAYQEWGGWNATCVGRSSQQDPWLATWLANT